VSRFAVSLCLIVVGLCTLATGPAQAEAYVVNFDTVMNDMAQSAIWNIIRNPPYSVLPTTFTLDPAQCDMNGGFDISQQPIVLFPNGILDSDEFALMAAILADVSFDCTARGGTSHKQVHDAWNRNYAQAWKDLGGTDTHNSTIMRMVPDVEYFYAGATVIGDQDTMAFPLLIVNIIKGNETVSGLLGGDTMSVPNVDNYTLLYPYLGWCGDADGDGCSNFNEYQWAKDQGGTNLQIRARYIAAAMNPAVFDPAHTHDRMCDGTGGLLGEYFSDDPVSNRKFTHLRTTRIDHQVTFDWGSSAPGPEVPANNFSVCWTGFVTPEYSEAYTFLVRTDDGVRLWVNDELIIDEWSDHGATTYSGATSAALTKGVPYSIRMDFYEGGGDAVAWLGWESASQPRKGIYEMYLTPGTGMGDRSQDWYRNPANGHFYRLSPQPMSWTDGNTLAGQWGGYLVTINDAAENLWIRTTFGPTVDAMFTGANDMQNEGQWVWAENGAIFFNGTYNGGTTVAPWYANWAGSEPNDAGGVEDAGQFYSGTGLWNDLNPANTLYCLVETGTGHINMSGPTPGSVSIREGDRYAMRVDVRHPVGNVHYQWRRDGVDITDANDATLTIDSALFANAGRYTCIVSDDSPAMQESSVLQLAVLPKIKMPAASLTAMAGMALALAALGARRRRS